MRSSASPARPRGPPSRIVPPPWPLVPEPRRAAAPKAGSGALAAKQDLTPPHGCSSLRPTTPRVPWAAAFSSQRASGNGNYISRSAPRENGGCPDASPPIGRSAHVTGWRLRWRRWQWLKVRQERGPSGEWRGAVVAWLGPPG